MKNNEALEEDLSGSDVPLQNKVRDVKVKGIEVLSICPFGEIERRVKAFHAYYGGTVYHFHSEKQY